MPIDKSSTILTIILAFIFLGEPITLVKGMAVLLIGVGTFMMIHDKLSILVSIAFSYIVFRERLTKKAVVGLCLIVAGTLIMLL